MENTISTLRRWLWGLILAFVILVPSFREVDYKSYAVSLGFLLLLLLEGLRLFKRPELSFSPLELYLALYVGWTCLSYFWSPVDLAASEYLGRFLPCVGLFLLVRQESPEQIASLRPLLWLGGVLCAMAFGFLQGLHLDWLPSYFQTPNGRIFSIFGNPNVYAAFLILSFPVLLLNLPRLKKPFSSPVILGIFTLLFLTSLRLTGSRAGFAALAVEILVLLFMAWPGIAKIKYGKWVILLLSIIVLGFFAEMATAFAFRSTERLEIWKGSFQMILAKPLQGWGVGQFSLNFQPYMTGELSAQALKDNTFAEHVHNEVLEMGVELGLVGLLVAGFFWLRLMGRAIGKCLKSRREGEAPSAEVLGLTVGLLGLGMTNLFDYNCRLSGISFFLWMSAGLLANRAFPTDKIKFKLQVGALLGILLIGGAAFGLAQESRLLAAVLRENPEKDFLKEIPADLPAEQQRLLESIKTQPQNPENYHELGNLFAKSGKLDEAQKAFEKELELNPQAAGAYLNLGNILLLTSDRDPQRLELARVSYEKYIQLEPKKVDGHFDLAYVHFLRKDLKEALAQLDEVLKIDPQNAKALSLKRQILP